uniref:Uncharacterized protein n=1 Tax=Leersia perrieri TaxID=77586 RepID=A0A0D9WQE6_9ORYZ
MLFLHFIGCLVFLDPTSRRSGNPPVSLSLSCSYPHAHRPLLPPMASSASTTTHHTISSPPAMATTRSYLIHHLRIAVPTWGPPIPPSPPHPTHLRMSSPTTTTKATRSRTSGKRSRSRRKSYPSATAAWPTHR